MNGNKLNNMLLDGWVDRQNDRPLLHTAESLMQQVTYKRTKSFVMSSQVSSYRNV